MEFVVENLSPTRKKIAFTLTADDVNAAINTAVKGFQKDLSLPGFRKGKVPASVVEKRFGEDVYARATQDEINGLLQKTLKDSSLTPVSSMEMDNHDAFARDTEFKCNVTFDVLPEIEFPNYEGLEVDQAKADVSDDDVNEIIENLRGQKIHNMFTSVSISMPNFSRTFACTVRAKAITSPPVAPPWFTSTSACRS